MGNNREDWREAERCGKKEEVNGISKKPASGLFFVTGYQVTGGPILIY